MTFCKGWHWVKACNLFQKGMLASVDPQAGCVTFWRTRHDDDGCKFAQKHRRVHWFSFAGNRHQHHSMLAITTNTTASNKPEHAHNLLAARSKYQLLHVTPSHPRRRCRDPALRFAKKGQSSPARRAPRTGWRRIAQWAVPHRPVFIATGLNLNFCLQR